MPLSGSIPPSALVFYLYSQGKIQNIEINNLQLFNAKNRGYGLIPKVAIMMGCFNGAKYIAEQLDSIESQSHSNWCVYASDDGSSDETVNILRSYQSRWEKDRLVIIEGPAKGFCANFLTMAASKLIVADFYAFCDQDDVWLPNKLQRALEFIDGFFQETPKLYCSRTTYVDNQLSVVGRSPVFIGDHNFGNSLVQNIAGGNTMVFNRATKILLEKFDVVDVKLHDWWLYLLVTGACGNVYYDKESYILYRQHEASLIGSNSSFIERLLRLKSLFLGDLKNSINKNIDALASHSELLCADSLLLLEGFKNFRNGSLLERLIMIRRCSLKRYSLRGTLSLYLAAILKRI